MLKSPEAFRTISEVAETLDVPPHVLRFWETRFAQVKPVKRGGGRRYYRPEDVRLLRGIRGLLYDDGMTIKGVQKILRERGVRHVIGLGTVGDVAGDVAGDGEEAAPVRGDGRADRQVAAEVEEFEVEEFESGADDARDDVAGEGTETSAGVREAPVNGAARGPQADLFPTPEDQPPTGRPPTDQTAGDQTAGDQTAADQTAGDQLPADQPGGPRPAGDRAALRELIGKLEALRAVMTEARR